MVDMKNTLGRVAHPGFFLASTAAIVGAPSMTQLHRGMDGTAPAQTLGGSSKPYERIGRHCAKSGAPGFVRPSRHRDANPPGG
jgi:hypothetical protein